MPIFLDSSNLSEVEQFHRMGIIRGVTTNPTIMLKDGVVGGTPAIEARAKAIARLIAPLPVCAEVTTNDRDRGIEQAKAFVSWADNIVVEVTIHGPQAS